MTQNIKEEKTMLNYDERRKILNQKKTMITENMSEEVKEGDKVVKPAELVSTVNQSMIVDYTEAGIRLAQKNLANEKKFLHDRSVKLVKQFEAAGGTPEDLKEFKKKIEQLGKYDASEKARLEDVEVQKRLKEVSKEIKELEDEIGTRLKF